MAYEKSPIRIITVGLNPSDKEFRNSNTDDFTTTLRFPDYNGTEESLEMALNRYFEINPYNSWFKSFEYILNGMDASYYTDSEKTHTAIHTDICSPWATIPTWSKISKSERDYLRKTGFEDWKKLVEELKPHIILFSIRNAYINELNIENLKEMTKFDVTGKGKQRKKPVIIHTGIYRDSMAIFGKTWNLPFGALGTEQKNELGRMIKANMQNNRQ